VQDHDVVTERPAGPVGHAREIGAAESFSRVEKH
jgi:hypothetical protein